MKVELSLYGAFRDLCPTPSIMLEMPEAASVADLRAALHEHALRSWPSCSTGLLAKSAFASTRAVLRDAEPVPDDGLVDRDSLWSEGCSLCSGPAREGGVPSAASPLHAGPSS
ncbi:MAG: hypothetical protein ABI588_08680 [Arenimonas sp.]